MSAWLIALTIVLPAAVPSAIPTASAPDLLALQAYVDGSAATPRGASFTDAVARMRAQGPRALDDTFVAFAPEVGALRAGQSGPRLERVRDVLDAVAQQRDAYAAQLFWETDLEVARARAAREHKPILSLRMLGNLSDELSCANSRFFRTLLYPELAELLRSSYVLHWQSMRPVPVVTIDMGDGRTLKSTVAGNSVHLVLDAEGLVVDALPGLVDVATFRSFLKEAQRLSAQNASARAGAHRARADAARAAYRKKAGHDAPRLGDVPKTFPLARSAARLALTKASVELSVVLMVNPEERAMWRQALLVDAVVAADPNLAAHLSPTTLALLARKIGPTQTLDLWSLAQTIARDTALNLYGMRPVVDEWLASAPTVGEDTLTARLYDTLFETPSADPWLGLLPAAVYTGVEHGGVQQP